MQTSLTIRPITPAELPILEDILYEAIYQPDPDNPIPRSVLNIPEVNAYIKDFGQWPHDYCLVAEADQQIAGAVWVRIIAGPVTGFGNTDADTPEFSIALFPPYRNRGIGTKLMEEMLHYLKTQGYAQTSLSVHKGNAAIHMYERVGFRVIEDREEDYLMVCKL